MSADFLDCTQVARRFVVSRQTVYSWIRRGQFPAPDLVVNGHRLWRPKKLDRWSPPTEKAK